MGVVLFTACESESNGLKKVIATDQAPKAIGPYSQAILVDGTLYLAGQIALDPSSGKLLEGGIEVQTHRVMQNLNAVLESLSYFFVVTIANTFKNRRDKGKPKSQKW